MKGYAHHYVLPKRLLRLVTAKLSLIASYKTRSAANALLHLCGQFHAAPGTIGRHFFLCRQALVHHPAMAGHSEHHIREATNWLQMLKFIRKVWSADKARRRVDGIRRAPTLFAFCAEIAVFFPAAHQRAAAIRSAAPPVCQKASPNLELPLREVVGMHTGEPVPEPKEARPPTGFDARMNTILAGVMAHAAGKTG